MKKDLFLRLILMFAAAVCALFLVSCTPAGNENALSASDTPSITDISSLPATTTPVYASEGITLKVGDIVLFGNYEQDNDETTQNEPIEWIVLEVKDGEALLISKYCLDRQPFNKDYGEVIWEYSYLRDWLNKDFFNAAFTAQEQERILLSLVESEQNAIYGTKGGRSTEDRVYILSVGEARKYFSSDAQRSTDATEFAKSRKGYIDPDYEGCWWWLRTVGFRSEYITNVRYDGLVGESGQGVDAPDHCVRPVIRISL